MDWIKKNRKTQKIQVKKKLEKWKDKSQSYMNLENERKQGITTRSLHTSNSNAYSRSKNEKDVALNLPPVLYHVKVN